MRGRRIYVHRFIHHKNYKYDYYYTVKVKHVKVVCVRDYVMLRNYDGCSVMQRIYVKRRGRSPATEQMREVRALSFSPVGTLPRPANGITARGRSRTPGPNSSGSAVWKEITAKRGLYSVVDKVACPCTVTFMTCLALVILAHPFGGHTLLSLMKSVWPTRNGSLLLFQTIRSANHLVPHTLV